MVTGVGAIAAPGVGMDELWKGLQQQPGPAPMLIPDWDPERWIPRKDARRIDKFTQLALIAADEAITGAEGLDVDPTRVTVSMASGIGGMEALEELVHASDADEPRISPFLIPMMMANAAGAAISIKYGYSGQVSTPVVACAAGSQAILDGLRQVQWGYADAALVGGSEAAARKPAEEGFKAARALSPTGYARPFDRDRDGFVMGECAAVLVLEAEEVARARGVTPLAELLGGASTADAYHVTAPHPEGEGAERAIRLALQDSDLGPDDISYINAHGTGTELNDLTEGRVIARVFDRQPAVSSIKATTGHGLGASGALEAAVVVETIRREELPPNIGLANQDPEIPLDDIVTQARPWSPAPVISNSFGFGGHNTVLVFGPV
jgi:3-oxoacyl-[acyl-carrier-protein] synthase II